MACPTGIEPVTHNLEDYSCRKLPLQINMLQAQNLTVLKTVQKLKSCYGQAVMKIGFGLVY